MRHEKTRLKAISNPEHRVFDLAGFAHNEDIRPDRIDDLFLRPIL